MPRVLSLSGAGAGQAFPSADRTALSLIALLTSFEGRIGRIRFWTGLLALAVLGFALGGTANVLDWALDLRLPRAGHLGVMALAAVAATAYCFFALQTKRWHDRDKSGWWNLLVAVPVIGLVWLVVEAGMLPGTAGRNQFGADPVG